MCGACQVLEPLSLVLCQHLAFIFHTFAVGNEYGLESELKNK